VIFDWMMGDYDGDFVEADRMSPQFAPSSPHWAHCYYAVDEYIVVGTIRFDRQTSPMNWNWNCQVDAFFTNK
jgi:hypothetical protein